MRSAHQIREDFLSFFESKGHQRVPSSPLIPAQDPTLLFTNAGMNQFKDVFLGREARAYRRAATSQKCMRVSGKHNDLDQVGRTPRHHTFFEMLGNFSFGDYFKKEAIGFAWELLTGVWKLPKDRLHVTVFRDDDEAYSLWRDVIKVPESHISRLGEKDNFWSMGDTGPCGPCSEIHYDKTGVCASGRKDCDPGHDCGRFMELWNLVFMQYDRQSDGALKPLARTGVDTGMGLERIASVLQDVDSNYKTDLFVPILRRADELARSIGGPPSSGADARGREVALQVIADHTRALTFLISDGVVPSNEGRGYVLRRILRRAIGFARDLGVERPFLGDLSGTVIDIMQSAYPGLVAHRQVVADTARREEERFAQTLAIGDARVRELFRQLRNAGTTTVPGAEAFRLYDTFGVPYDMIADYAQRWGLELDEAGFRSAMEQQRARSRRGARETSAGGGSGVVAALPVRAVEFEGYETTRIDDARVLALVRRDALVDALQAGEEGEVLLDRTPFYAESGGQIGDTGFLTGPTGVAEVRDTQAPVPRLNLHRVVMREGTLRAGDVVRAEVDRGRREAVMRSHDATHLLHAALRDIVGAHVKQSGSLVDADRLRFDFSHFAGVSDDLLGEVEDQVNDIIRQDLPIRSSVMAFDEALRRGALAFFGDKYGDVVRVVEVPGFSMELCGGTHASSTGSIGLVKITTERGIAAGVRRIEALSGEAALRELREDRRVVSGVQSALNVGRERVHETLARLLEQNRTMAREIEKLRVAAVAGGPAASPEIEEIDGVRALVPPVVRGLEPSAVRALVDRNRDTLKSGVVVQWAALDEDRVNVTVSVSRDLVPGLHAGNIVKELAGLVGGRGGGRPDLAEAGGRGVADPEAVRARSVELLRAIVRRARAAR